MKTKKEYQSAIDDIFKVILQEYNYIFNEIFSEYKKKEKDFVKNFV